MRSGRVFACGLIFAFLATSQIQSQKKPLQPGEIILIGKLTRVMGIGGETTGWSLELKSEAAVEGQKVSSIEVAGPEKKLARFADQEVKARGFIKHRHGVERKDWTVLEVNSIWANVPRGST